MAVKISPNGKYITFLKSYDGVLNIWLQNVGDNREAIPITRSKDPIFHYRWAQNNDQILFFQDFKGDENSHLYSVDLKTSKIIDLTPFENVQARIIRGSEKYPDEIVVAINNRDPSYHDLWVINTRTGERRLAFKNNEKFGELFVDHAHQLRIGRKSDILDVVLDPIEKKPRAAIRKYLRLQYSILDPKIQSDMQYLQIFFDADFALADRV